MIPPESGNACARDRDLHMEGLRKTSSRTHSAEPVTHCAQGDDRNCLAGRRGRRIYLLGACGETGPASKEMMMTTRRQLQASQVLQSGCVTKSSSTPPYAELDPW